MGQSQNNITVIEKKQKSFPIVAIGVGAGGLIPIESLFAKMPHNSDIGFIVVQNGSLKQLNNLVDYIQGVTTMKVYKVKNGQKVKQNCIYVVPKNRNTEIINREFRYKKLYYKKGASSAIDFLYSSLAIDQNENSVCIILSGSGTDGTLGLKAIKENGGLAIVQSPYTADYDDMPQYALNTGLVDYITKPEKIPEKLLNYFDKISKSSYIKDIATSINESYIPKILIYLHLKTGHDFSLYKQSTIIRRLNRRMKDNRIENTRDYFDFIRDNTNEAEFFFKELLIGVTNFFRDLNAFYSLKKKVIPEIFFNRDPNLPIRIWVPGCSTGEEAYSLSILFHEAMVINRKYKLQIFATDIDPEAIKTAGKGIYPEKIEDDIPKIYLQRYFTKIGDSYAINGNIRESVVFAEQSIIKDTPFIKLDLISCRNLLIYMNRELQEKVLPLFQYSLNRNGFLFLGSSESLGKSKQLFSVIDGKWKIFKVDKSHIASETYSNIPLIHKIRPYTRETGKKYFKQ